MITLLAKIFIKHSDETGDPAVRRAYGMLCGAVGIALNLCLAAGKFLAGVISGSISVTADAFNNLLDAASSVITLIGFKLAGQKPDPDHPFGHGRIEYVTGFLVSVLTLLTMLELGKSSVQKILSPQRLSLTPFVFCFLIASVLVKCYMCLYNRRLAKKLDSAALRAAGTDSLSDALATTVVLAAALLSRYTDLTVDGWCGLVVCLFIGYAGLDAARDAVSPLLGQAPDREFVQKVHEIVLSYEGILGLHDLIVHNYGPGNVLISLHAEVPADGDLMTLHDLIDTVEHRLPNELQCNAVIHMDPVRIGDTQTDRLKRLAQRCVAEIGDTLSIHDFRIAKDSENTRLIFDVSAPYDFPMSDAELAEVIDFKIRQTEDKLLTVIDVDRN